MTETTKPLLVWRLFFHDGMNKLNTAKLSSELALMTQESHHLRGLEKSLEEMEDIMRLYDQFMRIDHTSSMPPKQIIDKVNEMLEGKGIKPEIKCKCRKSEIQLDPLFVAIFYNLVTNSQKHSGLAPNDLIITIEIKKGKILFADNGKGIKDKHIFDAPGHALGIIRQMGREVLGFSIRETGAPGQGVRFELTFAADFSN